MTRRQFQLEPFRGLRFVEDRVGDLGTVVSPPYDVLSADLVRELEAMNRRNIVRLTLSRQFERPYRAVLKRLNGWRDKGYLAPDGRAGLYVYEYTSDQITVRGLIGVVALRDPDEQVILPHEGVMEGPVDDRAVLMRTTGTNLEPILLVHRANPRLRALLQHTTAGPVLAEFDDVRGDQHRLWVVTDGSELGALADGLAQTQALIADGHHRYAAYLRLQEEHPEGGWDHGLALLVDQDDCPLRIGAIHRFIAGLTLADLTDLAEELGHELSRCQDRETAIAALAGAPGTATFVLCDGHSWATYRLSRSGDELDVVVLHDRLLAAWQVAEEQLSFHHSLDQAVARSRQEPGVCVAMSAATLDQVMSAALEGRRLPRKATSFHPKPSMGVVMRDLRDR